MLSTAPWNCHHLLDRLLPWIISAKSQRSLTIYKGTGKLELFPLFGCSLEDATDPLKGHSKPGTSEEKCCFSLTEEEQVWKEYMEELTILLTGYPMKEK